MLEASGGAYRKHREERNILSRQMLHAFRSPYRSSGTSLSRFNTRWPRTSNSRTRFVRLFKGSWYLTTFWTSSGRGQENFASNTKDQLMLTVMDEVSIVKRNVMMKGILACCRVRSSTKDINVVSGVLMIMLYYLLCGIMFRKYSVVYFYRAKFCSYILHI